jgi:Flp pilus assembly protein TadG
MKRLRSRGVAAIEAAIVMAVLAPALVMALNLGRLALNGAALDRAASNAARYLATVPIESLRDSTRRAAALTSAQAMIDQTLAAAMIDVQSVHVEFTCDPGQCSGLQAASTPSKVGVLAVMEYRDVLDIGNLPLSLSVYAEVGRGN